MVHIKVQFEVSYWYSNFITEQGQNTNQPQPGVLCDKTVISAGKQERSLLYSFIHRSKIQCILVILLLFRCIGFVYIDRLFHDRINYKTELVWVSKCKFSFPGEEWGWRCFCLGKVLGRGCELKLIQRLHSAPVITISQEQHTARRRYGRTLRMDRRPYVRMDRETCQLEYYF